MFFKIRETSEKIRWKKEKEMAIVCGQFLIDKGYEVTEEDYAVVFKKEDKSIRVVFERYDNWVDIFIVFDGDREYYDIGSMAFVIDGISNKPREVMNRIIIVMDYIEKNYDKVTDHSYCIEGNRLVNKYIRNNKDKYGLNIP